MSVVVLEQIEDTDQPSEAFTPESDFYVCVDKGSVSLSAKLPGMEGFYLLTSTGINNINSVSQHAGTMVQVTPFMEGTEYKLVPQSKDTSAKAYQEE